MLVLAAETKIKITKLSAGKTVKHDQKTGAETIYLQKTTRPTVLF